MTKKKDRDQCKQNPTDCSNKNTEPQKKLSQRLCESSITDWLIVFFSFAMTFTSILQWAVIDGQLKETVREFNYTHRPWCAFSGGLKTIKPLSIQGGQITSTVEYSVKNGGTAPALKQTLQYGFKVGSQNEVLSHALKTSPCDVKFLNMITPKMGNIILPGDSILSTTDLSSEILQPFPEKGVIILELCVGYRDESDALHYTGNRWIYKPAGSTGNFPLQGIIPGQWQHYNIGGAATN